MSPNLSLCTTRIPALRPQRCLFQHRRIPQSPRAFSTSSPQAFAATCLRLRKISNLGNKSKSLRKASASASMGPAPRVSESQMQQEGGMVQDIGMLQDTIIRPPLTKLPSVLTSWFWQLMWRNFKSKATGWYTRIEYNRCMNKRGREYYLPIDRYNASQFKYFAATHYTNIYTCFAKGDMSSISRSLLPPIHSSFNSRIARRKNIQLDWKLLSKPKCKIMSHRAAMLGHDAPDCAYRQLVVRIMSTQSVRIKSTDPANKNAAYYGTGLPEKVVEYLVLQRRVINGRQDPDWMVWGFAEETTSWRLRSQDEYWREMLSANAESR
ncbi:hypothetical protein BDU57DRAFT_520517 [Ampelomyces quisqualis]|uniref:Tim44-like domain-containing protein n=1 Tax=Ampelomyces quisqualis TaxID=50730 RepID=A0A6A5QDA2_AMPQU|nr:hypothetical protein BDU57DRAFT_520517 [Ampelomyces quisqualis]